MLVFPLDVALACGSGRPWVEVNDYGAFVIDPDGYDLEVVCHRPE